MNQFREAIREHQWLKCEEFIQVVLRNLKPREMVILAVKQVSAFLPTFESYYPQVTWPREMLRLLSNGDPLATSMEFTGLNESYSSPGSDAFVQAISLVDNASQFQHDLYACSIKASNAIVVAIAARRYEYTIRNFPAAYKLVPAIETEENISPELVYDRHPEAENYSERIWSELASDLEALL